MIERQLSLRAMEGSEGQMQFIEWGGVLMYVTKAECRK